MSSTCMQASTKSRQEGQQALPSNAAADLEAWLTFALFSLDCLNIISPSIHCGSEDLHAH